MAFPAAPPIVSVECWTWYSLSLLMVVLRFISQHLIHGKNIFAKARRDDLIMVFAVCTYTIGIACLYIYNGIYKSLNIPELSEEEAARYGRQLGIVNILSETSIQTTLWCVKATLLMLNYRLTRNIRYHHVVIGVSIYTALSYVVIMIALYAGWCRPFSQYLVLNPEVTQCLTWQHYNTLHLTLNVSSDLLIFAIPLSVVMQTRIDIRKKCTILAVFGLGLFVIVAAIAQKVAVFLTPTEPVWLLWSIREISTAMLVGNIVFCQPLIRKCTDRITPWQASSSWDLRFWKSLESEPTPPASEASETEHTPDDEDEKRLSSAGIKGDNKV